MFWRSHLVTEGSFTERFLRPRRQLSNSGTSPLAVQSHRHFDLTFQQEIDCFISDFSLFLGSWGWVTELQFIVTHFFRRCRSFCHFGQCFPQCNNGIKTLWFSYLIGVSHWIQAFMRFRSIFGLLRMEPEFFQFTSVAFQKVWTQNWDFGCFREIF